VYGIEPYIKRETLYSMEQIKASAYVFASKANPSMGTSVD